jgi:hypothetical protein
MADGITHPNLNPESISWYDGQYEVKLITRQTHIRRQHNLVFSLNCFLKLIPKHIIVPFTLEKHEVMRGSFTL